MSATWVLRSAAALVALVSLAPTYLASTAATNLMQYESMTKKAAKVSSEADRQLWKTRYTQAAAILASCFSLGSAVYIVFNGTSGISGMILAGINTATCIGVRNYVASFWKGSGKVPLPGSGQYNDAIRATEQVLTLLAGLAGGWITVAVLSLI